MERFLKEKPEITDKTAMDYRAAVRVLGETPATSRDVAQIRRADVVRLKDLLLRAPTNWTKRFVGKTVVEAVQQNEKASLPTLSARTINSKYLSPLSTFFRWAVVEWSRREEPGRGSARPHAQGEQESQEAPPVHDRAASNDLCCARVHRVPIGIEALRTGRSPLARPSVLDAADRAVVGCQAE